MQQERQMISSGPAEQITTPAEISWAALQQYRILPTPRNYELFFAYYSGGNPEVTQRLGPHLRNGTKLTSGLLETIYEDCLARETMPDAVQTGTDALAQAAQAMVDQVSSNGAALAGYGDTLRHWAGRLDERTTIADLLQAVTALTLETGRASERNRTLEQELSTSAVRMAKLRQELVEVRQEATTDGLTGIPNRKAFETKLRQAVARGRAEPSSTFSLLLLDIDHFKRFNDTHGHRTGDHVLRLVGRLLTDNVKGRDTAARYGGEEFVILLADAGLEAGLVVARQICDRLATHRLIKRGTGEPIGQITVSVGVAEHRTGETGTALVERADHALYAAKDAGRNRVCAAPPDETAR